MKLFVVLLMLALGFKSFDCIDYKFVFADCGGSGQSTITELCETDGPRLTIVTTLTRQLTDLINVRSTNVKLSLTFFNLLRRFTLHFTSLKKAHDRFGKSSSLQRLNGAR